MRKLAFWVAVVVALMALPALAQTEPIISDLEQRAAAGDAQAAMALAQGFATGKGVPTDRAQAEKFYHRAMELGLPAAAYQLAELIAVNRPAEAYDILKAHRAAFEASAQTDGPALADYLLLFGSAAYDSEHFAEALAIGQEQLARADELEGRNSDYRARIKSNMAIALIQLGRAREAVQQLQEALPIFAKVHGANSNAALNIYNNLGIAYEELSQYQDAVTAYSKALSLSERMNGKNSLAVALQKSTLASGLDRIGKSVESETLYREALTVIAAQEGTGSMHYARVLADFGTVLVPLGKYAEALDVERQALASLRQLAGEQSIYVAATHYTIANILAAVGRDREAIPEYRSAIAIFTVVQGAGSPAVATVRADMAGSIVNTGDIDAAIAEYNAVLPLLENVLGKMSDRVQILHNNLAFAYARQNKFDAAIAEQEKSNTTSAAISGPASLNLALGLVNLAAFNRQAGDYSKALPLLVRAAAIYATGETKDADTVRKLFLNLADVCNKLAQPRAAILFAKLAINAHERLRGMNAGLSQQLSHALAATLQPAYNLLVNQQIAEGAFSQSQFVAALTKSAEFAALTGDGQLADAVTLTKTEQKLHDAIDAAIMPARDAAIQVQDRFAQARRGGTVLPPDATVEFDAKVAALLPMLQALFTAAEADHAKWQAELLSQNDMQTAAVQKQLAALGPGVALYSAISTDDSLHLFVSAAGLETVHREVRITRSDLAKRVFDAANAVETRSADADAQLSALYDTLVAPVADDLQQSGASVVMLDLAGFLRYVPYAALRHDGHYLVERYALALYNPAAHTRFVAPGAAPPTAAGFGVTAAHGEFPALPGVAHELAAIFKGPEGGVLAGTPYLDEAFTEASLSRALARHPRYVHIASHFNFVPGRESNSFLLLGNGDRLPMTAWRTDRALQFKGVDLLTLSACETARGGGSEGEEVESFGALAQSSGAAAVMATLWPIADESTARLMADFYDGRVRFSLDKATALQRAQIAMLRGIPVAKVVSRGGRGVTSIDDAGDADAPSASTAQPYYWAAFILMGNWM